jgi:hypothetical protein
MSSAFTKVLLLTAFSMKSDCGLHSFLYFKLPLANVLNFVCFLDKVSRVINIIPLKLDKERIYVSELSI